MNLQNPMIITNNPACYCCGKSAPPDVHQLAAMAMQGLLAHQGRPGYNNNHFLAHAAYAIADAMIAEREKQIKGMIARATGKEVQP